MSLTISWHTSPYMRKEKLVKIRMNEPELKTCMFFYFGHDTVVQFFALLQHDVRLFFNLYGCGNSRAQISRAPFHIRKDIDSIFFSGKRQRTKVFPFLTVHHFIHLHTVLVLISKLWRRKHKNERFFLQPTIDFYGITLQSARRSKLFT